MNNIISIKKKDLNQTNIVIKSGFTYTIQILMVDVFYFFKIGDTQLRFNSAVLLPDEIEVPSDGISRPGLAVIAECLQYALKFSQKKMVIAGHTDTKGGDNSNVELSKLRAEVVHGIITGDREEFAYASWGPHLTQEQRYPDNGSGKKKGVLWDDYIDILNWAAENFNWPCGYPTGNPTLWNATVKFQKSYNQSSVGGTGKKTIPEYGTFDLDTWRAVYDCYEIRLAEILRTDLAGLKEIRNKVQFVSDNHHIVSCGEYKPVESPGVDEYKCQTNRRVEIAFFDNPDTLPQIPCLTGACDPPDCKIRDSEIYIPVPPSWQNTDPPSNNVFVAELLRADGKRFTSEYPGQAVVANIDVFNRQISSSITSETPPIKDYFQPVANDSDTDLVHFQVRVNKPDEIKGKELILRFVGFPTPVSGSEPTIMQHRISFNDDNGNVIPNPAGVSHERILPSVPASGILNLSLEARTIPGSPFGHSVTTSELLFKPDKFEESKFEIQLLSRSGSTDETVHDSAKFSVTPVILTDRNAPVYKLYICDFPGNQPSVVEVTQAMQSVSGVELVKVPQSVANGDSWLQDQYQHTITRGPDGQWKQILLHLPRLRQNTTKAAGLGNLAAFVESHFPSSGIGVFSDLWERQLLSIDSSGAQVHISFQETFRVFAAMNAVIRTEEHLDKYGRYASEIAQSQWPDSNAGTWSALRRGLTQRLATLLVRVNEALPGAADDQLANLRRIAVDAPAEVARIDQNYPVTGNSIGLPVSGTVIQYSDIEADRLFSRTGQMHSGGNYGGNIESTPPYKDDKFGTIILGNHAHAVFGEFVDPDLKRVLVKQNKQRLVELDTTWLAVGHIDEIMAIVPEKNGSPVPFAILNADPQIAMSLIRTAEDTYQQGLPPNDVHGTGDASIILPSRILRRLTNVGTSPVTRLFRGKTWIHQHTAPNNPAEAIITEPPLAYRNLARAYDRGQGALGTEYGIGYLPGSGNDRFYYADMTIRELQFVETDNHEISSNDFISEHFIDSAVSTLHSAFPDCRTIPLPVLFDAANDTQQWSTNSIMEATAALSPDLVNLQVIGRHILLPRPYGPRMRPADAIQVVQSVMRTFGIDESIIGRVNNTLIARHHMQTGIYWVERSEQILVTTPSGIIITHYGGIRNRNDIIDLFRDSFPHNTSDAVLRQRIITPNVANFDGEDLRDGFLRFVIQENMVDLFELFSLAVLEDLDLTVHLVDSWFYHAREGGIHCGTNVLQVPSDTAVIPDLLTEGDVA